MALDILSERPGVFRVGKCDMDCVSGVTVVPVKLLEMYYPGGPATFVQASGVSRHITERDGFLFIASGSFGYAIGNLGILVAAHFVPGQDFVHVQVGDSAGGWYPWNDRESRF